MIFKESFVAVRAPLSIILLGLGLAAVAYADNYIGRTQEDKYLDDSPKGIFYRDVAEQLRCPTCTGLSVLDSDAKFSVQIKDIVKEQVEAGKTKGEILDFFVDRYGPWILRSPPKQGFNILAWAVPIAILVSGPPAVWFFVWRRRKIVANFGVRSTEEALEEMEQELSKRRASRAPEGAR